MTHAHVLVLGNSPCAWKIAADLTAGGTPVTVAMRDALPIPAGEALLSAPRSGVALLAGCRLRSLAGEAGGFEALFATDQGLVRVPAAAVAVAEECRREPTFAACGLAPAPDVIALSDYEPQRLPAGASEALFISGLFTESEPATAAAVMRAAMALQRDRGVQSLVLSGNLKVAAEGVEALSQAARAAGVLFFKFSRTRPEFARGADGRLEVRFVDELTGGRWGARPGLLVVDETFHPPACAAELAAALGIETDRAGFLQADNVRRGTVSTNRRGVFVAAGSRAGGLDPAAEAQAVVIEILALRRGASPPGESAAIDAGRCIRCLTCLRLCPHGAVTLDGRPGILPRACERCGLCAAECPRGAIRLAGMEAAAARLEELAREAAAPLPFRGAPRLAVFACRQSAAMAAAAAERRAAGRREALALIEVPCAGALPPAMILAALNRGADGVLVLACHDDLCRSRIGNRRAEARVAQAAAFLDRAGVSASRIAYRSLAANQAADFEAAVDEMLRQLGAGDGRGAS